MKVCYIRMKCIYLLALFIVAFSYCSCSSDNNMMGEDMKSNNPDHQVVEHPADPRSLTGLLDLPADILQLIIGYTGEPINLRNVSRSLRGKITLKRSAQVLGITGLDHVDDDERELIHLLKLVWANDYDPFFFSAVLLDQICVRRKPYNVLFRPLVSHLVKAFRSFDGAQKQREHLEYLRVKHYRSVSVESLLADRCVETGNFDLPFEFLRNNFALKDFVSRFKDRNFIVQVFRNNPDHAIRYLNALLSGDEEDLDQQRCRWIAECIINDLPEAYYEDLFTADPELSLPKMVEYLILSANVPEHEYQKIHAQIAKLLDIHLSQSVDPDVYLALRIINDIRYESFDLVAFQDVSFGPMEKKFYTYMGQAALLANKIDLLYHLHVRFSLCMDDIVTRIQDLNVNSFQAKNFKPIFEMIRDGGSLLSKAAVFRTVFTFYAVRHLNLNDGSVTFEFEAKKNLLEFGFPPIIIITSEVDSVFMDDLVHFMLAHMKVFNERSLTSFLPDLIEYYRIMALETPCVPISYEVMDLIANSPQLLRFLVGKRLKLEMRSEPEFIEKYFNLPNFSVTSGIFKFDNPNYFSLITKLTNKTQLEQMEWLCRNERTRFLSSFLYQQWHFRSTNFDLLYLDWRVFINYWIRGPLRGEIRRIYWPGVVSLLRLEFPGETGALLGPKSNLKKEQ